MSARSVNLQLGLVFHVEHSCSAWPIRFECSTWNIEMSEDIQGRPVRKGATADQLEPRIRRGRAKRDEPSAWAEKTGHQSEQFRVDAHSSNSHLVRITSLSDRFEA